MFVRTIAGLVVLGLACTLPAQAQPRPGSGASVEEMSLEELGSLEVTTVAKQPAEIWRSAAAVSVLTQDDIRRSGATTLPEFLRLIPGVQVSRQDSDHWAIGVRGLTSAFSKSLLVLIDGRSVYTPLFGGVFWQVQDTLIEDIERIEVIRGPGGTIWGANAVNGVINVITKNSADTTGALVSVGAGQVDLGRVGFRYGGRWGQRVSYRVYGNGFVRDAQYHADGHLFDEWSIGQTGFRIDRSAAGADTFTLQGDVYKGSAGDRVGVGSFFPPEQRILEGSDRVSGGNLLTRWQRRLADGGDLRLQAYYDRTNRQAAHFAEARNSFDVDLLHRRNVGPRHHLSLGAGVRFNPSDFTPVYDTLTFVPEDRLHRLVSAYLQDEIAVAGEAVWLTLGSKFEHNSYSGLEIQPSARLLWRRNARETLWGAVSRAVRAPSRIDADIRLTGYALNDPLAYFVVEGSPDFRAERLIGVEVGYRRLIGSSFYLDATAFHNNHDGLSGFGPYTLDVAFQPIPHLRLTVPYENAIRGTTDGVELAEDWRPASWVRVKGAYALLAVNMSNRAGYDDPGNIDLYEGSSPRHQGFVQASLTLPGRLEIDHTYRFSGRLAAREIPRYITADLRAGRSFPRGISLSVVGQNLLQPHHLEFFREDGEAVGIRRAVYAAVTWRR